MAILKGQRALVTGANSGIGEGVVRALAAAGASVVINYVSNEDKAEQIAQEIEADGGTAMAIHADVSNEGQVQARFQQMIDAYGGIDILVNNAGLQRDAPFHEMTLDQWNLVLNVNLTGQLLCAMGLCQRYRRPLARSSVCHRFMK